MSRFTEVQSTIRAYRDDPKGSVVSEHLQRLKQEEGAELETLRGLEGEQQRLVEHEATMQSAKGDLRDELSGIEKELVEHQESKGFWKRNFSGLLPTDKKKVAIEGRIKAKQGEIELQEERIRGEQGKIDEKNTAISQQKGVVSSIGLFQLRLRIAEEQIAPADRRKMGERAGEWTTKVQALVDRAAGIRVKGSGEGEGLSELRATVAEIVKLLGDVRREATRDHAFLRSFDAEVKKLAGVGPEARAALDEIQDAEIELGREVELETRLADQLERALLQLVKAELTVTDASYQALVAEQQSLVAVAEPMGSLVGAARNLVGVVEAITSAQADIDGAEERVRRIGSQGGELENARRAVAAEYDDHQTRRLSLNGELSWVQRNLDNARNNVSVARQAGFDFQRSLDAAQAGVDAAHRGRDDAAGELERARSRVAQAEAQLREAQATGGEGSYTVTHGDSLSMIAQENHVTVAQLLAANPIIKNKDVIQIGWKLVIPGAAPDQAAVQGAKDEVRRATGERGKAEATLASAEQAVRSAEQALAPIEAQRYAAEKPLRDAEALASAVQREHDALQEQADSYDLMLQRARERLGQIDRDLGSARAEVSGLQASIAQRQRDQREAQRQVGAAVDAASAAVIAVNTRSEGKAWAVQSVGVALSRELERRVLENDVTWLQSASSALRAQVQSAFRAFERAGQEVRENIAKAEQKRRQEVSA